MGLIGATQIHTTFQFVNDPSAEGLAVGQKIRALRSDHSDISQRPVLIELSYWQYLAIHVGANDVSSIIYDRERDIGQRQAPSLLVTDIEAFRNCLSLYRLSYIVVKSPELRDIVESSLKISPSEEVNEYAFYQVPENLLKESATANNSCPLSFGFE